MFSSVSAPRQVVNLGQNLTLSVTATGAPTPTYQWKRNGLPISGATATNYTITNAVTWRDNGWYQVVAVNSSGLTTSSVVFVNVVIGSPHIYGIGQNTAGQITIPSGMGTVVSVAAGGSHSRALKSDGTVVGWGNGQTMIPAGLSEVVSVATGRFHTLALKSDGTVVSWDGGVLVPSNYRTIPTGLTGVVAVATGGNYHSLALRSDGTVLGWGNNDEGQTVIPSRLGGVVAVAAGYFHSLALKSDGTVIGWGNNDYRQTSIPAGLSGVVAVAAGVIHSLALRSDGTVFGWGYNDYGQTAIPVGLSGVIAVAAGDYRSFALKSDGTLVGWGKNDINQTTIPAGLTRVVAVAAGDEHTLVLRDGTADFAPTITVSPVSHTTSLGLATTLSVGVNSGAAPNTYQWRKNGTIIPTATNSFLTIANAQLADAGSYDVVVSNYLGSITSVAAILTINKTEQTITFGAIASKTYGAATFAITATASSGLPVTFFVQSGPAKIAGNAVTITGAGTVVIGAAQSGNSSYSAATTVMQNFAVAPKTVAVTNISVVDKAFDGTTSATLDLANATLAGVVVGDIVTMVSSDVIGTFDSASIGVGKTVHVLGLTLSGANAPAYILAPVTLTGAIISIVPVIMAQPKSQTLTNGSFMALAVDAAGGAGPLTYQWRFNGEALANGTFATYSATSISFGYTGSFDVLISDGIRTIASAPAVVTVVPVSRISNLSILTSITASDSLFTIGTVIGGAYTRGSKEVLIRAAGPSLTQFSVSGTLADPKLSLFAGQTVIATNDNWGGTAALSNTFSQVAAFAFASPISNDAAVYQQSLPTANYTVQISGVGGAIGAVIAELYDATPESLFTATTPRLVNVSVLKQINVGELLTAGFVIGGTTSKQVLIRAIGPTLGGTPFNVPSVSADPKLDLFSGQNVIHSNNDWGGGSELATIFANVGAFSLGSTSKDAALLVTLAPGAYTAQVSGVGGASGLTLVEVYEVLEPSGPPQVATPAGFALIPAGTFTMGDSKHEGRSDELPTHSVTVSAFYLQQTEVTDAQWKEIYDWNVSGSRGYDFARGQRGVTLFGLSLPDSTANRTHPVTVISWWDVVKWCNAKSRKEGLMPCYYTDGLGTELKFGFPTAVYVNWSASGYRLPTEAEWEYAARGGLADKRYPWGDTITRSQANYSQSGDPFEYTTPVGYYNGTQTPAGVDMKNGFGLYDMAGNVWEWNWDWYSSYSASAQTDPRGPASGSERVIRGGSFNINEGGIRTAYRTRSVPGDGGVNVGFRPARSLAP